MINNKEQYIYHIKDKNEVMNMRRVLDKIEIVEDKHMVQATDFLDPYEVKLAKSILNRFGHISYVEDGGLFNAERKILIIYPDYMEFDLEESPIAPLSIRGNIEGLKHKDFLGSLLGLGITREKIGDILIHEDNVQIIVSSDISDYILFNLRKVGNNNINIEYINRYDLKEGIEIYKELITNLSSLRLDVAISSSFNLSRNDSLNVIKNCKVKVNWEPVKKPFFELKEGNLVSVRGHGRFVLYSIFGATKKDRLKVGIRIFK